MWQPSFGSFGQELFDGIFLTTKFLARHEINFSVFVFAILGSSIVDVISNRLLRRQILQISLLFRAFPTVSNGFLRQFLALY
jgi:hypothetical protein